MQFSCEWLGEYLEDAIDPERLAVRLTDVGLAVEGMEARDGDALIDIDVTTNRPDCMNYLGLAREAALALDTAMKWPQADAAAERAPADEQIAIAIDGDASGACPRYVGLLIEGVRIGPSPEWLQRKLLAIGSRPINNVVDVTNFVLWETGQPLHAFDRDRLGERRIHVRFARQGETLKTLDGESRDLNGDVLVIADGARPVALAGVMGGFESEVSEGTVSVLLESAHFAPAVVRRGAARLGMHTDASHRFERGADPDACLAAALRAATLVREIAGGEVFQPVDVRAGTRLPTLRGHLDISRLEQFAGIEIPPERAVAILSALGFEPELDANSRVVEITVPSWRYYDFSQTAPDGTVWFADLAEEVMRHIGFDAIPAAVAPADGPDAESAKSFRRRRHLHDRLSASGYLEALNYAFGSRQEAEAFQSLLQGQPLRLGNPISERYEVMRRSLLPGLLESTRYNLRRGAQGVGLFEIGHIFCLRSGDDVVERESIAVVGGGLSASEWDGGRELDLLDVKGAIEDLAAHFGVELVPSREDRAGFVPGTSGVWRIDGASDIVGQFGRLAEGDDPLALYGGELLARALPAEVPVRTVRIPSKFPGIPMDLTLTHSLDIPWSTIRSAVESLRPPELESFRLKVRYQGENVAAGAVATTISFLYQVDDRSLTQEEVNERHESLRTELERRFGLKGKEASE